MGKQEELLVPVNGFRLTPTGVEVEGSPPYEAWEAMMGQLQHVHICVAWWIGDMLNYGEAAYGERYTQAIAQTGLSYQTLANYKAVCKAIPREERVSGLSWSAHRAVAFLPPQRKEQVLEWAAEEARLGRAPTTREIQQAISIPEPVSAQPSLAGDEPDGPRLVQVLLTLAECQALLTGTGEGWESAYQKIEEAMLQF